MCREGLARERFWKVGAWFTIAVPGCGFKSERQADCQSAVQRVANPRYEGWRDAMESFLGGTEFGEDIKIFKGGGVAFDFGAGRDLFQEAAHDFSRARFGKRFGETNIIRLRD